MRLVILRRTGTFILKMEFFDAGSAEVREEHRVTKSYQLWVLCEKEDGTLSEPARKTLVFNIVCIYRLGCSGEIDRIVQQKWKDNQLHFSIRMLSNDCKTALANLYRDLENTISYLEGAITEECTYRVGKEQTSCEIIFNEVIDENIWTVAQSLRQRFPRVEQEESNGNINQRDLQENMRGRNQKRRRL